MNEKDIERLKDLQEVLVKKYSLEKKLENSPRQLDVQVSSLESSKKEYIELSRKYEDNKYNVNSLKLDLDKAIKAREDAEKAMDGVTSHREYEALTKQIQEATNSEQDIRAHLQKEEKLLSDKNENLKSLEAIISNQEEEINQAKQSLDNELSSYKTELSSLKKKEDKLSSTFDKEILFKFQRIIQRNAEGVVAVRSGVCTGCRMILPAQFANEVHKGESILFCPYCSRILFYEEATEEEEGQESFFHPEDSGS
ncbi:MAG: nucleic acid-binding protein, partial [Treponema sp.]|nr:nucleic acid-binding protein [Treponema sp.]